MAKHLIEQVKDFYSNIDNADLSQLNTLYSDKLVFKDPVHELNGLESVQKYLAKLRIHSTQCRFEYLDQQVSDSSAYLKWNMYFRHNKLGDKSISLRGVSQFQFDKAIYYHEDIYDMGSLVYEHVPGFGYMIRWLKRRLVS